jgi:hypothetical protein
MTGSSGLLKDFELMAGALVLLMNGSQLLSVDSLPAKKMEVAQPSRKRSFFSAASRELAYD